MNCVSILEIEMVKKLLLVWTIINKLYKNKFMVASPGFIRKTPEFESLQKTMSRGGYLPCSRKWRK